MNFDISEEQQLLQETLRQYAENECPPTRIRELFESKEGWEPPFWKGLVEMGMGGLIVPEEFGGAGLETLDMALAQETLGYTGAPGPFLGHSLCCLALVLGGSDAQKQQWLPRLAAGEALGSVAFAEGDGVWQPEQWKLAPGDTLTGEKRYVPHASRADCVVVGVAGGGLALLARDASGVTVEEYAGIDRVRPVATLKLEGAAAEMLPGGSQTAGKLRDAALVLVAADAFGAARRLVDMCVEYSKQRQQFGVTIAHFQALKHQLANMAVEIEPARSLYWYAAHAIDHIEDEAPRAAALAKAHICDRAMQIARDSVEAHGGIGFTWECDVQMWFKRIMFDRAFLGQPSTHRERAAQLAHW